MTRSSLHHSLGVALIVLAALTHPGGASALDPCEVGLCDCWPSQVVDVAPYFVPNYSGWQTAKKIWIAAGGGSSHLRFFSYAPNKYELIKFGNNASSETYLVTDYDIYLTAENNINNTNETRTYPSGALYWMPRFACRNKPLLNQFTVCHGGERFYTNCVFTQALGSHCAVFKSKLLLYYGYNYGYNVGAVDTVIKVDTLDDGAQEKYYYGKNRGFLRWEYFDPSGAMTNWWQQIDEVPNSPLVHGGCFQP